jgi:succinyl-diaminopimelate desuccinylase
VPAQGNIPGRIEDGVVHGLGASDMKGGLAVMIELAGRLADGVEPEVDLGFLFFPREELAVTESPLPMLFATVPRVLEAGLVIVLEPTDNTIQAGCLGNLNARVVVHGESAHSARPWLGRNAIDLALERLRPLAGVPPLDVTVEGLVFREVLSLTQVHGGIAQNVIPNRVEATLNFRYAPGRTPGEAEARLRELAGDTDLADDTALEIVSNSPPAHVAARTPLVERLRAAGDFAVEPKQAWTPVAEFAAQGLDAVNLGPGATRFAHRADEQVEIAALERTLEALLRFATGSVSA